MDIWEAIKNITSLVEIGSGSTKEDEKRLIYLAALLEAFKLGQSK